MRKIDVATGGYIYTRTGSKKGTWQLYYYCDGQELKCSLKTSDEHEAVVVAKKIIMESAYKASKGQRIKPVTFGDVAETFLKKIGDKSKEDKRITVSYLIPFFGRMEIDRITAEDIEAYYEWRQEARKAYIEEERKKHAARADIMRNSRYKARREKADKEFSTGFIRDKVSASATNSENAVLRAIFKLAAKLKYIGRDSIPVIENASMMDQEPREGFSEQEVRVLLKEAEAGYRQAFSAAVRRRLRGIRDREPTRTDEYREARHVARHLHHDRDAWGRWKLWHAIAILAATGMRPQSLLWMRPHHVRPVEWGTRPQAPMLSAYAGGGHGPVPPRYMLRVSTAKGRRGGRLTRDIVPEAWATQYLARVLTQPRPEGKEALLDYASTHAVNKRFKVLLERCGLTYDEDGTERSLYSLRHYYITKKLTEGVSVAVVAENTLTSMPMIEKYYAHIRTADHYDSLASSGRR